MHLFSLKGVRVLGLSTASLAMLCALVSGSRVQAAPSSSGASAQAAQVNCIKTYAVKPANNYLNYAPAIGSPEVTDAIHSGLQPCASFANGVTGSAMKYQVAQFLSPTVYPGQVQLVIQGGPDAAFLVGGAPGSPIPSYSGGPYVARFDPATGAQIWRTPLPQLAGQWVAAPSGAVVKGGWVDVAVGPTVYKLDPKGGAIVASVQQPVLAGAAVDANFDGFAVAPDSTGTILLKSQSRSPGCPVQGNPFSLRNPFSN